MPADTVETPSMTATEHRASFFRQSGWMMFATVAGGVFMTVVHFLSKAMPEAEYGQFGVCLSVAMFIPAMPLQMVLAEQTARARALHREHELSGLIRAAWLGTFVIWLVVAGVVLLFQSAIMAQWKITNPVCDMAAAASGAVHRLAAACSPACCKGSRISSGWAGARSSTALAGWRSPPSPSWFCITMPQAWCWVFWPGCRSPSLSPSGRRGPSGFRPRSLSNGAACCGKSSR